MKARSIVFFSAVLLTLASIIALIVLPADDKSTPVPFDKNNERRDLSYIEVSGITRLAERKRMNSGSTFARSFHTLYFYMITDINDSRYIVRMSEERAAELQGSGTPITIYGRGTTIYDNIITLFTSNARFVGNYENVTTNSLRFESKDEFHETFGRKYFVEGSTGNPARGNFIMLLIFLGFVLLVATPKYISRKRLEKRGNAI